MIVRGHPFALALRRQRKVLLLFLLTILAPAAVLSVFGLRALGADRFRIERLMLREQEEAMRDLRRRLSVQSTSITEALRSIAAGLQETEDWFQLRREILPHLGSKQLSGSVITVSSDGNLLFVREGFLRLPEDGSESSRSDKELRDAERFEFALGEPHQAASRFARRAKAKAPEIRLAALNGLGRTYARTGQYSRALSAYRDVLRQWPEVLSSETAPLPLMAGLQILFCLDAMGQPAAALPELVSVYEAIVERRWIVDQRVVEFYSSEYERAIAGECARRPLDGACSTYQRLRAGRDARLEEVRRLDALATEMAARTRSAGDGTPPRVPFWLPRSEVMVVSAAFPPSTDSSAEAGFRLLATVSRQTLLDTLGAVDEGSGSRVRVADLTGKVISGDPALEPGDISLREKLGDGLPDWTVTLFPNPSELEHFVLRTRNLYVALTGLLIAILLLGAFFIARTVHHEMEVIRIKSDFVSLVSHEFKTPIASMRALMDRLQAGHVSDPERRQRYYDIISGELQRVTRLVNNVLDFSRMEEGRKEYSLEETDLPQLVRDLLSTFEAGASAKGFTIETDIRSDLAKVRVDRDAISQALLNLLDNAVKYSPGEKWIRVAVERNSHALKISVADRGSGIPPDEVAAIFGRFYRGGATRSQPVPGLGLGLSLVEHVMAGHGGRVTVESPPGSGSVFTLSIPLPETPTPEA